MEQHQSLRLWLEFIWWALTGIAIWAVLYPINKAMNVWPLQVWNIVFVVTLITFARYTFLLKHTFLAKQQVAKVVIILALFPITFTLIGGVNTFLAYIEDNTWESLTGHLPTADKRAIEDYIWVEMIFFGIGSVIASVVLGGRLFHSIWRLRNRGVV